MLSIIDFFGKAPFSEEKLKYVYDAELALKDRANQDSLAIKDNEFHTKCKEFDEIQACGIERIQAKLPTGSLFSTPYFAIGYLSYRFEKIIKFRTVNLGAEEAGLSFRAACFKLAWFVTYKILKDGSQGGMLPKENWIALILHSVARRISNQLAIKENDEYTTMIASLGNPARKHKGRLYFNPESAQTPPFRDLMETFPTEVVKISDQKTGKVLGYSIPESKPLKDEADQFVLGRQKTSYFILDSGTVGISPDLFAIEKNARAKIEADDEGIISAFSFAPSPSTRPSYLPKNYNVAAIHYSGEEGILRVQVQPDDDTYSRTFPIKGMIISEGMGQFIETIIFDQDRFFVEFWNFYAGLKSSKLKFRAGKDIQDVEREEGLIMGKPKTDIENAEPWNGKNSPNDAFQEFENILELLDTGLALSKDQILIVRESPKAFGFETAERFNEYLDSTAGEDKSFRASVKALDAAMAMGASNRKKTNTAASVDLFAHLKSEASGAASSIAKLLNQLLDVVRDIPEVPDRMAKSLTALATRDNFAHALYPVMGEEPELTEADKKNVLDLIQTIKGPNREGLVIQLIEAYCLGDHARIELIRKQLES